MKYPVVKILSPEIVLLGEIDLYTSLYLNRRWQAAGEFELHVPANAPSTSVLKENNLIMLDSEGRRNGIIRSVTFEESDQGSMLTVKGCTLNGLACQRYTVPAADPYNDGYDNVPAVDAEHRTPSPVPAETILKTYADRHMVSPSDSMRTIPRLVIAPNQYRGMETVWMSRYEPLDTVLQRVSEYTDTGWEIRIDPAHKQLVFDIVCGVDRSVSQNENSRVMLSRDFESISTLNYGHDITAMRNVGYAGGAGEGADRTVLKVTNDEAEATGLNRFETFLDCGEVAITESDVSLSLSEEGKHKLLEYPFTESLTATIASSGSFVYLDDWNLGDKVTIFSRAANITMDTRIIEVVERYETQNFGLDVKLGTASADLGRVIRSFKNIVR